MNILFVYSLNDVVSVNKPLRAPEQMQFGISYISALLKRAGHNTNLIVLSRLFKEKNKETVERIISKFAPILICFSAVATEYAFIAGIAKYIKDKYPQIFLLIGGPHASLNPQEILEDFFDAVCIGEGEYPVFELAESLSAGRPLSGIKNIWRKTSIGIERNPLRPYLEPLDALPFPDRELWQPWIADTSGRRCAVLLGRGCPYVCSYCCNHAFQKLAPGNYVRLRTPENIISELNSLALNYPALEEVYFEIETITNCHLWALELCKLLKRFNALQCRPISFGVNIRITPQFLRDADGLFSAFQESNFRFINIGLESGSERVRSQILRRYYRNDDINTVVKKARAYGLQVCFYNLIGIPGETIEDFHKTIEFNRQCQPDWHFLSIFYPYPGTDLYKQCLDYGFNLHSDSVCVSLERRSAPFDWPGFSSRQIEREFIWFDYNVYKGYRPIHKIMARVALSVLTKNLYFNWFYRFLCGHKFVRYLVHKLKPATGV